MTRQALVAHALVVLASLAGIIGMGIVFGGVMHGSFAEASRGVPFLLIGLWWAGREMGRSMEARRARSERDRH